MGGRGKRGLKGISGAKVLWDRLGVYGSGKGGGQGHSIKSKIQDTE